MAAPTTCLRAPKVFLGHTLSLNPHPSRRLESLAVSTSKSAFRLPSSLSWCSPKSMLRVEKWNSPALGPLSERAMREKLLSEGYSVSRYVFSPGTVFDYHQHSVNKKDSILSGKFLFRMDGEDVVLEAGDMLVVPAGKEHYAEVLGTEPVVFFDASKYS